MTHIALIFSALLSADPLTAGDHARTVTVDGLERNYRVHVPTKYDGAKPVPVVLIFHGGATNADVTIRYTGMNAKSDEAGFLAVYPNGTGRVERILTWNAGDCCGYAMREKIDDVAFVKALLDDLATVAKVDADRVFSTGISNGAMISYRLANELSDRIAAIAPIAGGMSFVTAEPLRPVPVIHFHGTKDEFAPYEGGRGPKTSLGNSHHSVQYTVDQWVAVNDCERKPTVERLPDTADDGMNVEKKSYRARRTGADFVLYTIDGGGHTWPGRPVATKFLGPSTRDISANDLMWEFFEKHPRRQ